MKNNHLTKNSLADPPIMFKHSERLRLALAVLAYFVVQALGIGALLLAPALHSRAFHSGPAQAQVSSAPRTTERSEVDLWRDKAAPGGPWADLEPVATRSAKASHKRGFAGSAL